MTARKKNPTTSKLNLGYIEFFDTVQYFNSGVKTHDSA